MARHTWIAMLRADIHAICANDPAIRHSSEVVLYPGLHAIIMHRLAHALWLRGWLFVARLLGQLARLLTGVDIHPGAQIGAGLFIDHGMGVVIGETAVIGDGVTMHQGVTLGGTGKQRGKRHPTVEDGVVLGVNAVVLGAITVGAGAKIGGGAVVVKDVPPHTTAVGVPARVVVARDPLTGTSRRVEQLPDPHGDAIRLLQRQVQQLQEQLADLQQVRLAQPAQPAEPDFLTVLSERRSERSAA